MNRIEIKADGKLYFHASGDYWEVRGKDGVLLASSVTHEPEPDRVTITLTEREATRVMALTGNCSGGHTGAIFWALHAVGVTEARNDFDFAAYTRGQKWPKNARGNFGYAHAERIALLSDPPQYTIRLTMDRDVAVTLRHLLACVAPIGELESVRESLIEVGAIKRYDDKPRFTGTITWRKKRLKTEECVPGKSYKFVGAVAPFRAGDYEWEEV